VVVCRLQKPRIAKLRDTEGPYDGAVSPTCHTFAALRLAPRHIGYTILIIMVTISTIIIILIIL
jgi:hypothetical protein